MFNLITTSIKREPKEDKLKQYVNDFQGYNKLPRKTKKTLEKLWDYDFPSALIKRLKKKYPFNVMSDKEITTCLDEYKKFIAIMVIGRNDKKGVAMTSNIIDEIWHEFILFTIEYHKFSEKLNGKFIHHTPNTQVFSFGPDAIGYFYATYEKYFGKLNPIWQYTLIEDDKDNLNTKSVSIQGNSLDKNSTFIKKYQIHKRKTNGRSVVCGNSMGKISEKSSSVGGCGGMFLCGGITAANGSGIAEGGACGAGIGDGGDGGGCGGCGGCGG